jgi:hypothetical protein
VKSPIDETELVVGLEIEDTWGAGVKGCSGTTGELEGAKVEGVRSEVDGIDSVIGGTTLDSSDDGGKDREYRNDVGVGISGDSSVDGNSDGEGDKDGGGRDGREDGRDSREGDIDDREGGNGGKAGLEGVKGGCTEMMEEG